MCYQIKKLDQHNIYFTSLFDKINNINFVRQCFEVSTGKKINDKMTIKKVNFLHFNSPEIDEIFTSEQIYLEYSIETTNSLFDVLLQIINTELKLHFTENKVSYKNIKQKLNEIGTENIISEKCENILNSESYKYINAFTNITKHRFLIKKGNIIGSKNVVSGPKVDTFFKDGKEYPEKNWKEAYQEIDKIIDMIIDLLDYIDNNVL
jgi:hypothetical protein